MSGVGRPTTNMSQVAASAESNITSAIHQAPGGRTLAHHGTTAARRARYAVFGALAAVIAQVGFAPAQAAACTTPQVVKGPQVVSVLPTFPVANANQVPVPAADEFLDHEKQFPTPLNDAAVDPAQPDRLFVVNADTVLRSEDGGCRWSDVYHLPHQPPDPASPSAELDRIISVSVGPAGVFLTTRALRQNSFFAGPGAGRNHVIRSTDGGRKWSTVDTGVPPVSGDSVVVPAPGDRRVAYLSVRPANVLAPGLLARSDDGGTTWLPVSYGLAPDPAFCCWVDAVDPQSIWAVPGLAHPDPQGVTVVPNGRPTSVVRTKPFVAIHSADGGQTWSGVPGPSDAGPDSFRMVGLFHAAGRATRLLARGEHLVEGREAQFSFQYSEDGGKSYRKLAPTPVGVTADPSVEAVFRDRADSFVLVARKATPEGKCAHLYSYDGRRKQPWQQLTSFVETREPGVISGCSGALLAAPGRQQIVRELAFLRVTTEQVYLVGYRGAR